jgi:outer membrane protein insertion porin family
MRLLRPFAGLAALLAAISAAPPAAAQGPGDGYFGRTVTAVQVTIEGRPETNPQLIALVSVPVGEPLRPEDVRTTMARFARLPGFEDVRPTAEETPGGVAVTFDLIPRHAVDRIEVTGSTGIGVEELQDEIRRYYGGVPATEPVARVEETVERLLADYGYENATVDASTVRAHDPDRSTLVLKVEAGELSRIASITVIGQSPLEDAEIIDRTGVRPTDPFRSRDLAERLAVLEDELRADGYYEALATSRTTSRPDGGVDLVVEVEAGPRVDLRFTGDPLPPGDPQELVPIELVGSADEDLLEDSRRRIENALRSEGYRDATVSFTRDVQPDGSVLVITYTVERGFRYRIARVELAAGLSLPRATIEAALELQPGDPFSEQRVLQGLSRVVNEYLQRGFYQAAAEPAFEVLGPETPDGEPRVVVFPNLTEGPRATVETVEFDFGDGHVVSEADLRAAMQTLPGAPYVAIRASRDRSVLQQLYRDRGFREAAVVIEPAFSQNDTRVALTVRVTEGGQTLVSDIVVIGNEDISTEAILAEVTLRPGAPLGDSALRESRQRLYDLGIFRSVNVIAEPPPGETQASVIVSVEESPATTVGYGGGLEAGSRPRTADDGGTEDHLEISPRGFFEISRRNLGGRNRSINLFSRIALKPRNAPGDPERDGRGFGFSEYRVNVTFRERRAFDTQTELLVGLTSEQAVRTTFNFIRQAANAEFLRVLSPRVSWSGRYRLDFTRLFDERFEEEDLTLIDRLFPQVRLSTVSTGVLWDRRDSALDPTRGTLTTGDLEVAARAIGSEVGYVKTFAQAAGFRALTSTARSVLAGRVQLGLARGFERTAPQLDENGNPVVGPDGEPVLERVADLPASQRFFAGGGTTVRGFQNDRLGVAEILRDGLSLGGNALLVANLELRTVVRTIFGRNLSVVGFLDAGNVFARASDLDLGRLRGTYGFGFRYDSPLGPIRLDFGFKMDRRPFGTGREPAWEYHLSIGEVF